MEEKEEEMKDRNPSRKPVGDAGRVSEPLIIRLVTNVSRIAGLAAGCADAMALCKASSNIQGVIRVFREIQQLAEEIVPAAPEASKTPAEGLPEAEQSPPQSTP